MVESLVKYEQNPPAAVISLNRPDKRNALSRQLIAAIGGAFDKAEQDAAARCVILTGAGTVFCAGMDLAQLKDSLDIPDDESPVWDDALKLAELYNRIYTFPKPVIAAVNGAAVAGGAGLVSVCDMAIATPEAKFGYPEARRGLVAAMVMPHLLRHVGERAARYLLLTGELLPAERALQFCFINDIVDAEVLMEAAHRWAVAVAECGPDAVRRTKELLRQFSHQSVSVEEAAKASAGPRLTAECKEGLRAFFEKKPAPWAK